MLINCKLIYFMKFHQGQKLKNLIEKSNYTLVKIIELTGIKPGSFYLLFAKEKDIPLSKLEPILQVIGITTNEFFGTIAPVAVNDYEAVKLENEALKNDKLQWQADKIKLLEQLVKNNTETKKNSKVS